MAYTTGKGMRTRLQPFNVCCFGNDVSIPRFHNNINDLFDFVIVKTRNEEIFHLHADFCQMLANPKRLMILALLSEDEMSAGDHADSMETAMTKNCPCAVMMSNIPNVHAKTRCACFKTT